MFFYIYSRDEWELCLCYLKFEFELIYDFLKLSGFVEMWNRIKKYDFISYVNIVIYNWKKGKKRKIRKKFLFMIKIDDLWYKKCFLEIMVDVESRC